MRRVVVLRLSPSPRQLELFDQQGHAARWFWNALHEWYTVCRENGKRGPSGAEIDLQLREMLRDPLEGYEWLQVLGAQSVQHVHQDYAQAWARCWSKRQTLKCARPPRYKSRHRTKLSFNNPARATVERLSKSTGRIKLLKVGWVKFRWTQPLPREALRGARLVKTELGWQAYVRLDLPDPEPRGVQGAVGVDRGVVHALATSDGEFFDLPELLTEGEKKRLLQLERTAARRKRAHKRGTPTSRRLENTYDQIRELCARAKRRRQDWQHKVTTQISDQYGHVSLEKLNVQGMTRSARGTVEEPGTNVRQKSGLNRTILDVGWSAVEGMLQYKTQERGSTFVHVSARYTSQTCSSCGHRDPESRRSQSIFLCTKCGYSANADTNAAQNINAAGLAVSGRGGLVTRQPAKRQSAPAMAGANV